MVAAAADEADQQQPPTATRTVRVRPPEAAAPLGAADDDRSTGANPRPAAVVTLTPVATTATKNSIWNIAVSAPTIPTRRHSSAPATTARSRRRREGGHDEHPAAAAAR